MRILLLTAPIPVQNATFPIGLSYIGTVLKEKGHQVKIVDAIAPFKKYSKEDIVELIKSYKPDIVGLSLFINFIADVYDFLQELKRTFSDIVFVAGGPHASAMPEELVRHGFDFVVIGEGEETASELVESIGKRIASYEKIRGIAYKDKKYNEVVMTEPRALIKDLDTLPFPERESFPIENYTGSRDPASDPYFWILSSSRGCPFDCLYCMNADVFGRGYRFRSAENIFQEIKNLYGTFNTKYVYFIDDEFMIKRERLYQLGDLLVDNKLNIGWTALARITTVDTEFINRMVKVGLKEIVYGVESADPLTLEKINKRMSLEQIRKGIEHTLKSQIPSFGVNNMIGFPWEKKENILNTYKLNKSIGNSIPVGHSFWVPIPYPRTGLYNLYHKQCGFTGWWLNKKNFIPEYDQDNYQAFFKKHMVFLDHPQLKINLYKYKFLHRVFIKKIFTKVWLLQADRRFSRKKKYFILTLSLVSYGLYLMSPKLEKLVFKAASRPKFLSVFQNLFHIERQFSIAKVKARNNNASDKETETRHRDLFALNDKIINYLRESKHISLIEEKEISDDFFSKPDEANCYIEFFRRNVAPVIKDKRILEFGSGQGILAMEFSRAGAIVTGIDIDANLVNITGEFAGQRGLTAKFISYDKDNKIPLEDEYFDFCYSIQTFEHMDNPIDSLRELYRVMKKGGILHITFPNRFYPYDDHARLFLIPWLPYGMADFVTKLFRKHDLKYYSNLHFYSYRKFNEILKRSRTNFSIIKKIDSKSPVKRGLINLLHKCNMHHTIATQNISVFLKKY